MNGTHKKELINNKKRIKVKNVGKKPGLLYHYGHFFHDVFMPEVNLGLFEYDQIIRMNKPRQTIGVFGDIYNLFGLENIEVSETEFNKIECQYQPVKPYHSHGFETDDLIKFRNFINSKLSLSNRPKTQIVLIKRGHQQLLKNSKKPSYTGVRRREISEINKLGSLLKTKGYNVKSVVLENMNWPSQVGVFKSADTIIGAHGAGLCNVVFCDPETNVIEVKFKNCRTFERMSRLIGLNHYWVDNSIEKIINLVNRIVK